MMTSAGEDKSLADLSALSSNKVLRTRFGEGRLDLLQIAEELQGSHEMSSFPLVSDSELATYRVVLGRNQLGKWHVDGVGHVAAAHSWTRFLVIIPERGIRFE